ncbi:protein mono-ADP-ribosyltransferase PARP12-like [Branchiostoma floridae x Branchiostoma belcheri]
MATAALSELEMLEVLCSQYNGTAKLDVLWRQEFQQLGLDFDQASWWFRQHPNKFRLHETTNGEPVVSVMVPRARLCFGHITKIGCKKGNQCRFFHLCRNFLQGSCNRGARCKFTHDLQSEQAGTVIRELQLHSLQDDEIINVIRLSTPKVCHAYNTDRCVTADLCPDVHICSDFVRGRCATKKACRLSHEGSFDTPQTRRVLFQFRLFKADQRTVLKTLLIPPATVVTRPPPNAQANASTPAVKPKAKVHDPNKERILDSDTTICEGFLSGRCLKSRLCGHHHIRTPYLWQYHDVQSQGNQWVSFSPEVTSKMEEVFSQPSNVSFNLGDVESSLNGWTVHFDTMELEISDSHPSKYVRIRRLSTQSSVQSANGAWSTKWVWYWEDKASWCEYGSTKSPSNITSDDIEQAYLQKQSSYNFQTDEFPYILDFTGMYQQNLNPRYSTKRLVRRRPVFVQFKTASTTDTSQPSSMTKGSLPTSWKPMPQNEAFITVPLAPTNSEFKEVEKLFRQTMGVDKVILQVERVQNPRLWEKYNM